ncbi:MAG: hypothetical protein B7Z78_04185 [Rhodospirillales bacterium 20-60-12]|nr:MAG: hypothetical protein B7Z78_04185 [Rhodospirillales bacterium 20-60-12]HQT67575.1 LysR family transcriptional regulator [Acetobacteraceae bacterium]
MLRINLTPSEIEAFLSLAETGSFSRTGAALGLSQPAVSARISHLEENLGVPLFNRTTRRVTITHAGERLRARLGNVIAELHGLVDELRDEANLRRGRINIGTSPSVAAGFLAGVIASFHTAHPKVEIVLHDDFYGHALERLQRGDVDIAIIPFEPDEKAFNFELLFTDRFLLAVPAGHILAEQHNVTLKDIAALPLITMPPESAAWTTIKRAFENADLKFRPAMQSRNSLTIVALVRAGFGIAFVTELMAKTFPLPEIKLLDLDGADLERRIGITSSKERAFSPATLAFCRMLRTMAERIDEREPTPRASSAK